MGLTPGYKQTEVGVIPEDWLLRPFSTVVRIASGQVDPRNEPFCSMYLVAPDHIESGSGRLLKIETAGEQHAISGKYLFTAGDIVYSKIRPYLKKAILADFDGLCSADMYPLRPFADSSAGFVFAAILGHHFSKYAESVSVRSGMPKINRVELAEYIFALPPTKAEQEKVVEVLSDVDTLIESLEQLLTKKRHLKQGAVQELLRPKPGWVCRKLLNIAPLQRGFDLPNRQLENGPYPVVYSNGVLNHHRTFMVNGPGLVTGRSGTLGVVQFIEENFWPHNTTLWVTDFKGNNPKFIYYLYSEIGLDRFGTGSGVPTLNRNDVHDYSTSIPKGLEEQIAIAAVLSDMDAEIATLETKLTKVRQLKQGIMQELLTGRIRLI